MLNEEHSTDYINNLRCILPGWEDYGDVKHFFFSPTAPKGLNTLVENNGEWIPYSEMCSEKKSIYPDAVYLGRNFACHVKIVTQDA